MGIYEDIWGYNIYIGYYTGMCRFSTDGYFYESDLFCRVRRTRQNTKTTKMIRYLARHVINIGYYTGSRSVWLYNYLCNKLFIT